MYCTGSVSPGIILEMVEKIRRNSYTALRSVEVPKRHLFEKYEWLPEIEIDGYHIPEGSHLDEKRSKNSDKKKNRGYNHCGKKRKKGSYQP